MWGDVPGLEIPVVQKKAANSKASGTIKRRFALPDEVEHLVNNSFLNDKLRRTYLRIVKERIQRFNRKSE